MAQSVRIFVPRETAAISLGADEVAAAIEAAAVSAGASIDVVRNGSRGLTWLEPLVEVETGGRRTAYGPVTPADIADLLAAGLFEGADHPLALGDVENIPYLNGQQRWTFRRVGLNDPLSLDAYCAAGGFEGLERAFECGPAAVLEQVLASGLRGRGGAGFPAGVKWRTVAEASADRKYIACNADEGDSGTFSDRILMESDPFTLIEGMAIAGYAVGANKGYIYLRSEYPLARRILGRALDVARAQNWLGTDIQGSGLSFDIELHLGAGSYV